MLEWRCVVVIRCLVLLHCLVLLPCPLWGVGVVEGISWEGMDVHGVGLLVWRLRVRDLDDGRGVVVVAVYIAMR